MSGAEDNGQGSGAGLAGADAPLGGSPGPSPAKRRRGPPVATFRNRDCLELTMAEFERGGFPAWIEHALPPLRTVPHEDSCMGQPRAA